ncbi:DNA primase [Streptomyces sp. ODS28]|uniref:DNA primase n=1 Tax=Streptomyces sp. ODS28 TaxID=3136688 RepID=UPI0031E93756
MTNRMALALAVTGGYVLGRTKKMRLALGVGGMVLGRRLNLGPRQLAGMLGEQIKDNPQLAELGGQLREDLSGVGRAATGALVSRQLENLADSLHGRTEDIRDGLGAAIPGEVVDSEEDEQEEQGRDEERDEDESASASSEDGKGGAAGKSSKPSPDTSTSTSTKKAASAAKSGAGTARSATGKAAGKTRSASAKGAGKAPAKSAKAASQGKSAAKTAGGKARTGAGGDRRG